MCGRYLLDVPGSQLADVLDARDATGGFNGSWNAAPGQDLPVLRMAADGTRVLERLRWGLAPTWPSRDGKPRRPLVNARAETIAKLPSFRDAVRERRCIVPITGFYEWQVGARGKVPHCIRPAGEGHQLLRLAAIWSPAVDARTGEVRDTWAAVTTTPSDDVRHVHDRMPAVLEESDAQAWLETPPAGAADLLELLRPWRGHLQAFPVSTDVNSVRNDDPSLCEPAPVTDDADVLPGGAGEQLRLR